LLAPLYTPTTFVALDTVMSKSAIDTRHPSGVRGASLPVESRSVMDTAPQLPTGTGFMLGMMVTVQLTPLTCCWAASGAA
jgi:hypothetical protein